MVDIPYTIIGCIHITDDEWCVFSTDDTNSEIGVFDESKVEYRTVVNDKGLNFNRDQGDYGIMDGQIRSNIRAGLRVSIVLKEDQRTGKRTEGIVQDLLTNSPTHPHGIKVRLESGLVGRVQEILG